MSATTGVNYATPPFTPLAQPSIADWTSILRAIRAPPLELPSFSGHDYEDPDAFLRKSELFFAQTATEPSQWSRLAGRALKEPASKWWELYKPLSLPWNKFREILRQKYGSHSTLMRLNAQLYSRKQTDKESVAIFLQQKYLLALRLLPDTAEEDIVRILLESLRPSIRRVIRAASPQTFGDLMERAVEAEMDESEDQPRKEPKREEPRKAPTATAALAVTTEPERRRNASPCNYCPGFHFHRDCPTFKARREGAAQENWRSSAAMGAVEHSNTQSPQQ